KESWPSLERQISGIKDQEMIAAVEAQSTLGRKTAGDQSDGAIKRLDAALTASPGAQLKLFRALLQKNAGRRAAALQSLLDSMIACGDAWIAAPFGATEDEQRWQIVRLYAEQNRPRAALKLAGADERLKGLPTINSFVDGADEQIGGAKPGFLSLQSRS